MRPRGAQCTTKPLYFLERGTPVPRLPPEPFVVTTPPSPLYLVDGYNVLHAVVLAGRARARFWSVENQLAVAQLAARFTGGEARVVFDASRPERQLLNTDEAPVPCEYAPSADERIVQIAKELQHQRPVVVVSADRQLCDLARNFGATRLSPWQFAAACGVPPRVRP